MAYDEGLAEMMRGDLVDIDGIEEKKMFGGLAFMLHGNMVCGVHSGGGMFRIGKPREETALSIDGVGPMTFTGRKMGGMVDADDDAVADERRRGQLNALSLENARSLPPK